MPDRLGLQFRSCRSSACRTFRERHSARRSGSRAWWRFGYGNVGYQLLELWIPRHRRGRPICRQWSSPDGWSRIDVAPSNVAGHDFQRRFDAGTDTALARLLENTGATTAWLEMTVSVPTPTLSVMNDPSVTAGSVVNLSNMVTILDPSNVGYQKLELWDSSGTSAGGQFVVNGVGQTGGHEIDVAPANVANTCSMWHIRRHRYAMALLVQNDGTNTGWEQFTVGAQAPTLSVSNDPAVVRDRQSVFPIC